jgi:AAA15 family ATPase/GTPase
MKLIYLKVQNFRALEDIEIEFGNVANIVCGPNASGKSTIFEAIRLVRAVLAPRLQNEAQLVLIQLQALSQHYPQAGILADALTGDHGKPLIIEANFKLDDPEIARSPPQNERSQPTCCSSSWRTTSKTRLIWSRYCLRLRDNTCFP